MLSLVTVALPHAPVGLLQEGFDLGCAVVPEHGRTKHKLLHRGAVDLVAEAVLGGAVLRSRRPPTDHRAYWERLAGGEHQFIEQSRPGSEPRPYRAALEHVKHARGPGGWTDDERTGRVVGQT